MNGNFRRYCIALLITLSFVAPSRSDDPAWAVLARNDLQAIHELLRDNHPGPVDPENPHFRDWLEGGLIQATQRATTARSHSDYVRTLRFYTNGFQDGHIGIGLEILSTDVAWPGFIVGQSVDGAAEVVRADTDSGAAVGDHVTECDGRSIDELMKERVDPYFWNSAIPHERGQHFRRLFYQDAGDPVTKLATCRFSSGQVTLKWRRMHREEFSRVLEAAQSPAVHEPNLRQMDGIWIIAVPTFNYPGEMDVAKIRALLNQLSANVSELRKSTIVFDVRGNHGGDSAWGDKIAKVLWGDDWVKLIESSFDKTVDWRASEANIRHMALMVEREKKAGLTNTAASLERVVKSMKAAQAEGKPLARVEDRPKKTDDSLPLNPISGRVFFLTDGECASACLDFADLIRRLPGVTHVGLPTSADAIYIDNTYAILPSGLAGLGYSLKVYRKRIRKNNEWYEPAVRWLGGPMSDAALVKWLKSLR